MKKTLIAMVALSGLAFGVTEKTSVAFDLGNQIATSTDSIALVSNTGTAWTSTQTMTWGNMRDRGVSVVSNDAPVITLDSGSGWTAVMQGGAAVAANIVSAGAEGITIGNAANVVVTYTLAVDTILGQQEGSVTALTLGVTLGGTTNNDTWYGIYTIKADGTVAELKKMTNGTKPVVGTLIENSYTDLDLTHGDKVAVIFRDGNQATDYISALSVSGTKLIPEPATATLSLFALAGLAARRRRR